jgi:hypothetical protein
VQSIIDTGQLLLDAHQALDNDTFDAMTKQDLQFSPSTGRRLMCIAEDPRICSHVNKMPPHWGTLFQLHRLTDDQFNRAIADGSINPEMERDDVRKIIERYDHDDEPETTAAEEHGGGEEKLAPQKPVHNAERRQQKRGLRREWEHRLYEAANDFRQQHPDVEWYDIIKGTRRFLHTVERHAKKNPLDPLPMPAKDQGDENVSH